MPNWWDRALQGASQFGTNVASGIAQSPVGQAFGAANYLTPLGYVDPQRRQQAGQFFQGVGQTFGLTPTPLDPSVGQPNLAGYEQARADQGVLLQNLQRQMAGEGPSVAQGQLQQATDANIQRAMALGAAQQGQGLGYGAALRSIGQNQARAQQEAAGQSALLRAQEQLAAQQQYAALTGQMAGQALGAAGLQSQAALSQAQIEAEERRRTQDRLTGLLGGLGQAASTVGSLFASDGAVVPGRARVSGDSSSNDTVPAMLSPGEIVLPRSVAQAEDAPEAAEEFVKAIQARKGAKSGSPRAHLTRLASLERRIKALEGAG